MEPRRTPLYWLIAIVGLVALLTAFAIPAWHWRELATRILTHLDMSGRPNGWRGKEFIWLLLFFEVLLWIGLTVLARYSVLMNVPMEIDRNDPAVRQTLLRMSSVSETRYPIIIR